MIAIKISILGSCLLAISLAQVSALAEQTPSPVPPPAEVAQVKQEIQQVETILPKLRDRGAALFLLAHDYARLGNLEKGFSLLKECMSLDEGFDPEDDSAFNSLKSTPEFHKLIEHLHRRYPVVHRARVALRIPQIDLIPEGLAADHNGILYMGSLHKRKIVKITKNGAVSDFSKGVPDDLAPICGLKADSTDDNLWVNTCPDSGVGAELLHFDSAGKLEERFPPPSKGQHLFNDLVLRNGHEIYLTDSLANRAYRFERKSHTFNEVALCRDLYYPNGIALSDDGNLIYVADAFGVVQLDLRNSSSHEVDPGPSNTLSGADGLYWYRNSLIAIQNSLGLPRVAQFHLSPDGLRVTTTAILEYRTRLVASPTTGAISGTRFYFMSNTQIDNLRADKIVDPGKLQPVRISVLKLQQ